LGTRDSPLQVLGEELRISQGAPFVAYETGCKTFWISVRRSGERFIPAVEAGPARLDQETYGAFKARWLEFYGNCVDGLLRGDPDNLALRPQWVRWLDGSLDRKDVLR
jgi:hypothetical protein